MIKPILEQKNSQIMPRAPIKVISFDLDDTLYNNVPIIQRAEILSREFLQSEFERQGIEFFAERFMAIRQQLLQSDNPAFDDMSQLRRKALAEFCQPLTNRTAIAEEAFSIFYEARNQVAVLPEVKQMLHRLSQRFVLVSVTNGNCDASRLDIATHFSEHYLPSQRFRAKPHPQMLLKILDDFNLSADELLHVGDSLSTDGLAAQSAASAFYQLAPFADAHPVSKHLDEFTQFVSRYAEAKT